MFKFAHLLGAKARAADEHDEDEKARKAKGKKAEEDERDENAEEDDPDAQDDDEDDKKEGRKAKKAKGKKAEEDEDDTEEDDADAEDDDDNKDVKKGRRAERQRAAAIFGSQYAAGRPDIAAHLAFNTTLSASEAISTLKAMGSPVTMSRVTLDSRMRAEQQVRLGPDAQQPAKGSASALVQQMTGLYNANKGAK